MISTGRASLTITVLSLCFATLLMAGCGLEAVTIDGSAMSPTLNDGDRALIATTVEPLERGDVVGFYYPKDQSKSFVMRIVGLPSETLEIAEGQVVVAGEEIDENYVSESNRSFENVGPVLIPSGEYFVMGDNRANSADSRSWGTVPAALIWAKVLIE